MAGYTYGTWSQLIGTDQSITDTNSFTSSTAITQDGKRLVGHLAKRQAITNARNTVYIARESNGGATWRPS